MKVPKRAKRVFKGIIFDVYHWKQRMFDGSYKTFEAMKRCDSIRVLATKGNKILLAEENQPNTKKIYGFFGGRRDNNENHLDGAKRELLEETGLVSDDWRLVKIYSNEWKIEFDVYFFIARNCRKISAANLDSGEKIKVREVSFEQFLSLIKKNKLREGMITSDIMQKMLNKNGISKFRKTIFGK